MHINEIDKLRVLTCLQLFCDLWIFWILVCNSYESERSGKTVYGESISVFMAYNCLHNTHFPSDYNCNQFQYVTRITSQLDRCMAIA